MNGHLVGLCGFQIRCVLAIVGIGGFDSLTFPLLLSFRLQSVFKR